ncbi:MAG: lysophospholipid acyltransferase family protein [Pirellulaceae bacterium]|nr:lysophospholipid acyltransferase family protein [Pirellulaceae bacterium]
MTKRQKIALARVLAFLLAGMIRLWLATMRVRMVSADGQSHPADPSQARYIYAFWHETLLAPLVMRTQVRVLISHATDGELIARVIQRLGLGVIRGSTARNGSQALLEMIRGGDGESHLAITPDGPRGPRRELKSGLVMVSSLAEMPVVPIGVGFTRAWRFGSWDRFALPVPFSTLVGVIGEPLQVPANLDRHEISSHAALIQNRLLELSDLADDWAARLRRDGRRAPPPPLAMVPQLRKSA